jgi:hypothetical protein
MSGSQFFQNQLRIMTPHTYNALQKLVMAMADVKKNAGKKTFFGRDKGQASYSNFLEKLKVTLQSMILDNIMKESASTIEAIAHLEEKLNHFSMAHPNWQDAYDFANMFFSGDMKDAKAVVERLRSIP